MLLFNQFFSYPSRHQLGRSPLGIGSYLISTLACLSINYTTTNMRIPKARCSLHSNSSLPLHSQLDRNYHRYGHRQS
jgi:hypothetical protein